MPHIIDGHNLIGAGLLPGIRLGDPDDELQLLEQLRAYRARGGPEMIVFFDSGGYETIGAPIAARRRPRGAFQRRGRNRR